MYNNIFSKSQKELKKTSTLVVVAILIAMNLVLDRATTIIISPTLHVSFKFITTAVIGMLYGPVVGMYSAVANDLLAFLAYPKGLFFPGYTVTALCSGLIYGFFLYEKKITFVRIFLTKAIVNIVCNLTLNTLWSSILVGKAFIPLLAGRVVKNVIMLPVEAFVLYGVIILVQKAYSQISLRRL